MDLVPSATPAAEILRQQAGLVSQIGPAMHAQARNGGTKEPDDDDYELLHFLKSVSCTSMSTRVGPSFVQSGDPAGDPAGLVLSSTLMQPVL